ncbi:MAG: M20 family metallopeptidase [Chloroflexi bacterium]|nr:M20 family metallopeptidase [Chloroflexota bacterium]MBM3175358.1 M20 family metallopeptidase [Chloroflexota bacterium]MBM4450267.1 M20 family metallopeptidase [Chloroflexota bacterium]
MRVNQFAQIQPKRLKIVLRDLVDIYSPTGKEEEALEFTESYLKKQGLCVIKQEVDENRYNLIVPPARKDNDILYFIGHLDTVNAYDLEDYRFHQKGDLISGLGTTDMKAGCAAMLEVATVLAQVKKGGLPIGLAFVVGEEEDSSGAKTLVKELDFNWAIIGEPTNLMPCLGHYSYMEVLLRTEGKRAHSSMPELGQNAIEAMLKLLLQLTEYATSKHQELVYNIRQLQSFPQGFVVPDVCEAWLDLHLPPSSDEVAFQRELDKLVKTANKDMPGLSAVLKFEETHSGYRLPQDGALVKKLKKIYQKMSLPWEAQDFRSHSDGNVLRSAGVNPIILGPGKLEAAHTPEEAVSFNQVVQATQLYLDFALSLA